MPLATSAQATPPNQRGTDYGTAATADEAETAQNADSPIEFERQAGPTRFETSAEIATARFSAPQNDVVIATGEKFADALAGAGLEGTLEAPVLLVPSNLINGSIPTAVTNAIDELGASNATFLGGSDAISTGVENHIVDNTSVTTTDRVEGPTRFETAEEIASRVSASPLPSDLNDQLGLGEGDTAFLATGLEFADALAAGPGAYEGPRPTLLTPTADLHPAALRGLQDSGADNVIILGGNAAVSSSVESELQSEGFETARLAGADRWETATEVADAFADGLGFGVADVGLATGFKFADALSSAPYLGEVPAPVVLTPSNSVNDQPLSWFQERGCDIETIHVFGGQVAVQDSVAEGYAEAACPTDGEPTEDAITGTVTDAATGDPIEGATVTAENSNTFTDTTDADGEYVLDVDTPETYTVTADADGFSSETEEDVFVDDGEVVTVDFALQALPGEAQNLGLEPQEATNPTAGLDADGLPDDETDSEHSVTATVTDENDEPVSDGEQIRFEVYALEDADEEDTTPETGGVETTEDGEATFTYTFADTEDTIDGRTPDEAFDDVVIACSVPDTTTPCAEGDELDIDPVTGDVRNIAEAPNDIAEKGWEPRDVDALQMDPQTATNLSLADHEVEITVVDQFGDPVANWDTQDSVAAPDDDQVAFGAFDADNNSVELQSEALDPAAEGTYTFTYQGPEIATEDDRLTHRLVACLTATGDDAATCLDENGDLEEDVIAVEGEKDWAEVTAETAVQLNWQNEYREDGDFWGGVDDFAADNLANDGNGLVELRWNSELGVIETTGDTDVTSEIPDDGEPAGSNFHLHSGEIDAEGPVEIGLETPSFDDAASTDPDPAAEDNDDRGDFTYDLSGTVEDPDATATLQAIEDAIAEQDSGDVIDWYLNVHTVDNPAGEVRGQFQELDTTETGVDAADSDGGLSEIPAIYESLEPFGEGFTGVGDAEFATAIALNFDVDIEVSDAAFDPGEALDSDDFTVTVGGDEANVIVTDDGAHEPGDVDDQIVLAIDEEVQEGEEVVAVFEDSGREKVETAVDTRDGIQDGDLLRSIDTRAFEAEQDIATRPQVQNSTASDLASEQAGQDQQFTFELQGALSSGDQVTIDVPADIDYSTTDTEYTSPDTADSNVTSDGDIITFQADSDIATGTTVEVNANGAVTTDAGDDGTHTVTFERQDSGDTDTAEFTVGELVQITSAEDPINQNNEGSHTVEGSGQDGAQVTVVWEDTDGATVESTATVDDSATPEWSVTEDVSALADGNVTITATQDDPSSSASTTVTKDTTEPSISSVTESADNELTVDYSEDVEAEDGSLDLTQFDFEGTEPTGSTIGTNTITLTFPTGTIDSTDNTSDGSLSYTDDDGTAADAGDVVDLFGNQAPDQTVASDDPA